MTTIAADQAKTEFDVLLSRAAQGEEFTITEAGMPVARLVPVRPTSDLKLPMSLDELKEWRKGNVLGPDLSIRQLIEEGRKH
jgi:prevent-host-death family protein